MLSTYKKPALVLIISVLLFAGMIYLLDFEPLDFIRTHFYNPSFVNSIVKENEKAAEIIQSRILELQNKFADTLNEPAVKSSFLYNQTAADIYERSKVFGILVESVSGLQSVQFVDNNGVRIHYSTSNRDIISLSNNSATYRNYTDDSRSLPYDNVSVKANEKSKYTMDDSHDRIIFSFPFFDSMDVYRGTALFTLSVRALAERLITEGCLKPTDDISVIRSPRGIVFGSPNTSKTVILEKISSVWNSGLQEYVTLDAEDSGVKYALISIKTGNDLYFGRLINDSIFTIPESMKFIFQISMFLTLFLTLYFFLNFKPHPITLVQNRIKTLRTSLFEQLYIKKTGQDRAKWILELEQRRDEIRFELKSRIRIKRSLESKIDGIIDNAWDELLAVMKSGYDLASLEEIVKNRSVKVETSSVETTVNKESGDLNAIEEIEEVEEAEPVQDDIEEIEEVEEAEETEETEEAETAEDIEDIGNIEDIEDAEDLEDVETAEEVEDIDDIEEFEEVEEIKEVKTYREIQLSNGLLKAANEILEKIKKTDSITPAHTNKGLLKSAAEYNNTIAKTASEPEHGNGLLNLAAGFLNSIDNKKELKDEETEVLELEEADNAEDIEEIEAIEVAEAEDEEDEEEKPPVKGLLALATAYYKPGQAALASENLSVREVVSDTSEVEEGGEEQGLSLEMDVFSPFSSMFSSLENEKTNTLTEEAAHPQDETTSSTNAD